MTSMTQDTASPSGGAASPEWSFGIANEEQRQFEALKDVDLLTEANSSSTLTQNIHRNGESRTFHTKTEQIPLIPPPLQPSLASFTLLQKWEGYVLEVGSETFFARLIPLEGQGSDQIAEIYLDEIGEIDQKLVEPGAVFYWSIGYRRQPSGTKERSSIIRFRRLPKWTENELKRAEKRALEIGELFEDA